MDVLLRTKFERPRLSGNIVQRPRLTDRLQVAQARRLTLLSAPAGYGKTTLLSGWLQSSALHWSWLALDRADSDVATFATCLIEAIHTLAPGACHGAQAMLQTSQSPAPAPAQLAATLINDLAELPHDVTLVLDDYQSIHERGVHDLLAALIQHLPHRLHLIIATRADPPLPIAQWRARGHVAEIRSADLRFTLAETGEFLHLETGANLPEHIVCRIAERTEGWITGLKLATLSFRDRAPSVGQADHALVQAFETSASGQITDFLLEDVLSRQPRAVREFLMRLSILDRFCTPLCDVLGSDVDGMPSVAQAGFVLRWMERSNLFLIPLDEERRWYRFHHLFRDMLSQRLKLKHSPADIAVLHQRASDWLADHGLSEDAMHHALAAGDLHRVAALIEAGKHDLLDREDWHTLDRWLNLLPDDVIEQRPALILARATVVQFQGRYAQLPPLLERAAKLLFAPNAPNAPAGEPDLARAVMLAESHGLQGMVELFVADDPRAAHESANRTWERVPASHAYVRDRAMFVWAISCQLTGRFNEARAALIDMIGACDERQSRSIARALSGLAIIHACEGLWGECARWANQCLTLAMRLNLPISAGWARYCLGVCAYEHNDLATAAAHFGANAECVNLLSARSAHDSLIGLALTQQALGERALAGETIAALDDFDLRHSFAPFQTEAQSVRARLSLMRGDAVTAAHWLNSTDVTQITGGRMQQMLFLEIPQVTVVRAEIASGSPAHLQRAEAHLDALLARARALHAVRREVEALALQSLVLSAQSKVLGALAALDTALALAEPRGFARTFVDVGPDLVPLLTQLACQGRHAEYACELAALFAPAAAPPANGHAPRRARPALHHELIEPLTNRETEILQLLGKHLSNDEIAQTLFISPFTVKSHTRALYEKLGVKRRRFAIQRARELCLLPAV
jgi:LuxR family maltose regulon positive regulatory protein